MDLTANEKAVHADFFNGLYRTIIYLFHLLFNLHQNLLFFVDFEDLYDDEDLN